nr:hypothetical protein [Mycobacterium uberis]
MLDVNLLGFFHMVRAMLPAFIDRRGYVLIVSSLAAFATPPGVPSAMCLICVTNLSPTLCVWRSVRSVSASVRSTCRGSISHWFGDTKADLPVFRDLFAALLCPFNKTSAVDRLCAAFVKSIEGHKDRVYCPGWVGLFCWIKPLLFTRIGDLTIQKVSAGLVSRMCAEVVTLGCSTSAYNETVIGKNRGKRARTR